MSRLSKSAGLLWRPFRALFTRSPWWLRILLIVLPIVLVLALLDPVIGLFGLVVQFVTGVLQPLLLTPTGRLILLNVGLVVTVLLGFVPLRRRWRELRADALLASHLRAVEQLVTGTGSPEQGLERVLRKLERTGPPAAYPDLVADVRLKLARVALAASDPDAAVGHLARVREADLPPELLRSLAQLRTDAYLAQDALLPESVDAELDRLLERFPDDPALLARKRMVTLGRGDLLGAVRWQERVAQCCAPADAGAEAARLAGDLVAAGRAALSAGDLGAARAAAFKARESGGQHPEVPELLGEISRADGDYRAALRDWGLQPTPNSLARIRAELADPAAAGSLTPREILELSPNEGTLLFLAERYAREGHQRRALRILDRAHRELPPTETVVATEARLAAALGDGERVMAAWQRLSDGFVGSARPWRATENETGNEPGARAGTPRVGR